MNRFYYLFLVIGILCGSFTLTASRAHAQTPFYPNGLRGSSDVVSGIYPGTDAGNCCWLGSTGTFKTRVPFGADTLLLTIVEPDYAVSRATQSLRAKIGGLKVQERCCFGAGEHELTFALPADVQDHPAIRVTLWAGRTFVPKDIGLNQDPRHLSVLIRSVQFSNSATGQILQTSAVPDLQSGPLALLAAAGVIVLLLTLRRPIYGVAALVVSDPFLLAHYVHGTTVTLPKVALVAVALGLVAHARKIGALRAQSLWLLLGAQALFIATMIVSSVHAAHHAAALRETLKAVQYAATLVVAYFAYRADPDEAFVRYALCAISIIVCCAAIAQEFLGAPEGRMIAGYAVARIAGPLEGPNQFAGYLGVLVPAMLAFALRRPALTLERVAIALGILACLLTFSRAGVAALVLTIGVLLLIRYEPARRRIFASGVVAVFIGVFALAFAVFAGTVQGRAAAVFGPTGVDAFNGGLGSRVDLWHGAYALWRSHPLFGIGPGNFELSVGRYDSGVRTHANSMYFQVLAEQGIAGLIAMFAVVVASIGVFVRRLQQPLALAACAAAVAMAFHQIVDCMWVYPKVGAMWWIILALGAAAVDLRTESERVAEAAVA